jgi:peptidoglycan/LPS O-acetylase OafA/YrhL
MWETCAMWKDSVAIPYSSKFSASLATPRIANLDRLRIVAAILIVCFHTNVPYRQIGYIGLPIFLLIHFSLIASRAYILDARQFAARRWERLMVPWVFWSVVYAACKLGSGLPVLSVQGLLMGGHVHLWYLPYAFVCGLLVYLIAVRTLSLGPGVIIPALILGLLLLPARGSTLPAPFGQWRYALAAIPLGYAISRARMIRDMDAQRLALLMIALCVMTVCTMTHCLSYEIATGLVCLAYACPGHPDGLGTFAAPLTFGIYLIHPLADYGLRHCAPPLYPVAHVAAVCVVSGCAAFCLLHSPFKRFV